MNTGNTTEAVRFDEETATYRAVHDWENDRPIYLTVAAVVARAVGTDPTEVDPIAERIDPEALDGLFRPLREARNETASEGGPATGRTDGRQVGEGAGVDGRGTVGGGNLTAGVGTPAPVVDPSARRRDGVGRPAGDEYVQFVVADCEVTVTWDGTVVATPPTRR